MLFYNFFCVDDDEYILSYIYSYILEPWNKEIKAKKIIAVIDATYVVAKWKL